MHIQIRTILPSTWTRAGFSNRIHLVAIEEAIRKKPAPQLGMKKEFETTDQQIYNKTSRASNAFYVVKLAKSGSQSFLLRAPYT